MKGANPGPRARLGKKAIWQAKVMLLVMINVAQLWILSATIDAVLAEEKKQLIPLVAASAICWIITITIVLWWRPAAEKAQL